MSPRPCHYCGNRADSKDHIVARHWYSRHTLPQEVAVANKVPACTKCNGLKDDGRSDCVCDICTRAWDLMAEFILPKKKSDIHVVPLLAMLRKEATA